MVECKNCKYRRAGTKKDRCIHPTIKPDGRVGNRISFSCEEALKTCQHVFWEKRFNLIEWIKELV